MYFCQFITFKKKYGCVMDIAMKPPANKDLTEILCQCYTYDWQNLDVFLYCTFVKNTIHPRRYDL